MRVLAFAIFLVPIAAAVCVYWRIKGLPVDWDGFGVHQFGPWNTPDPNARLKREPDER